MNTFGNGSFTLLPVRENEHLSYEKKGNLTALRVYTKPVDYFSLAPIRFRLEGDLPAETCFIEIEYLDDFLSLISCTGKGIAGFTGLQTGRVRHAVFAISAVNFKDAAEKIITVTGCESLLDIRLTTDPACVQRAKSERIRKEELVPVVKLKKDMQLVTTCGIAAFSETQLDSTLEFMDEFCPLMRRMGFNGFESYVQWRLIEKERGVFEFDYYDKMLYKAAEYDLKWFPLIIVGSAYALPDWYHDDVGFVGFKCLEHGIANEIPTIFNDEQNKFVETFLKKFGEHYEPTGRMLGIRLGPSGNYGESQYPASGTQGYKKQPHHIHLGWWAADECAAPSFQKWLKEKYASIEDLSAAWKCEYRSFDDVKPFLPATAFSHRMRKDFVDWYNFMMTDWCEKWAVWARAGLPNTPIYQSIGGWGFEEAGTDFTCQPRSMRLIGNGGARSTNENDDYLLNNNITRMISSSARFYGVPYGSEPAGFGCARGVTSRFYNVLIRCGEHLFYYHPNLVAYNESVKAFMKLLPLLDERDTPHVQVAAYYPTTKSRLDDSVLRYLQGSAFFARTSSLRPYLDFDFCSEPMIEDGALASYKVLLFLSRWHEEADMIEEASLKRIDEWIRNGGIAIYPLNAPKLCTVEGDDSIYRCWLAGDTGKGRVIFHRADFEPTDRYSRFISNELKKLDCLDARTQRMLCLDKPSTVFAACYKNGKMAVLNFSEDPAVIADGDTRYELKPFEVRLI